MKSSESGKSESAKYGMKSTQDGVVKNQTIKYAKNHLRFMSPSKNSQMINDRYDVTSSLK